MTEARRYLVIDLAACDRCRSGTMSPAEHGEAAITASESATACGVSCEAMPALREKATFESVCRHCRVASCILACPFDALERREDDIVKRHNLRCVSCKSCALACPFGTIYEELLPFYSVDYESACGRCLSELAGQVSRPVGAGHARDRAQRESIAGVQDISAAPRPIAGMARSHDHNRPPCVEGCAHGALEYRELAADEPDLRIIDEFLAVRAGPAARDWVRREDAA